MTACAELAHEGKGKLKDSSQVMGLNRRVDGDFTYRNREDWEENSDFGDVGRTKEFHFGSYWA